MPESTPPIDDLPALPRDQNGPVFQEPWQAHAFALAVHLSAAGHFTWNEWVAALSQQIKTAQVQGDADLGDTYYWHWLAALEQICAVKGLVGVPDMQRRTEEWRRAYLNTPHGQPVALSAAFRRTRRES
jgi:nitrile hydratase accessory protein